MDVTKLSQKLCVSLQIAYYRASFCCYFQLADDKHDILLHNIIQVEKFCKNLFAFKEHLCLLPFHILVSCLFDAELEQKVYLC